MYDEDILRYCHTTNIEYMTKYIVTFTIVTVKLTIVLVFGLYRESIVFPSEEHERIITKRNILFGLTKSIIVNI